MLLPSVMVGDKSEKSRDLQQQGRPQDSRRKSTVYESASVIAEEIKRPAMVQDASRAEVEALYDFKSCLASGGTGSVWRAVDRRTGEAVAIKVIDKKKLNPSLFNMEVFAMQRCSGHPHIVQLLAAFDVPPSADQPNGEWHVVMELAEGGELFERLLRHGAYTELVASEVTTLTLTLTLTPTLTPTQTPTLTPTPSQTPTQTLTCRRRRGARHLVLRASGRAAAELRAGDKRPACRGAPP